MKKTVLGEKSKEKRGKSARRIAHGAKCIVGARFIAPRTTRKKSKKEAMDS